MSEWHLKNIPQTMFFYWGAPKISFMRICGLISFAALNPDWKTVLMVPSHLHNKRTWTSKEHRNRYQGPNHHALLEAAAAKYNIEIQTVDMERYDLPNDMSEVHKSDFLRLAKLADEGGFYSDTDIVFFRPISQLQVNTVGNAKATNLFCHNARNRVHYVGFFGSSPDNQIFKDLASRAHARIKLGHQKMPYQEIGCKLFERLMPWEKMKKRYPDCHSINMSTHEVYAYDHKGFKALYQKGKVDPSKWDFGIGIHWFGGHPSSASVETNLQPPNVAQYSLRIGSVFHYVWEMADIASICPTESPKDA